MASSNKKQLECEVISNSMARGNLVLKHKITFSHPKYRKIIYKYKKYYAKNNIEEVNKGDRVLVQECKPVSKLIRWEVVKKI